MCRCIICVMTWVKRGCYALVVLAISVGCFSTSIATPTPTPTSSPLSTDILPTPTPTPLAVLRELRQLGLDYWEAFNDYDLEQVLAYLEPSYREARKDKIKRDIRRLHQFRVKLGIAVESEPELLEDDSTRMYIKMREPLGTRRILMEFQVVDGAWMITYAQEVT